MKGFGVLWVLFLAAVAHAATLVTEAKVQEVTERGFVLIVGTEALVVEDAYNTRFWSGKAAAKRDAFPAEAAVTVRIKTDADPPQLREMADRTSWAWLEAIRKTPQSGTVVRCDAKTMTLRLGDGSEFAYRVTDKSKVQLAGKDGGLSDLKAGQVVHVKARTLPSLDVMASEVRDTPFAVATSAKKRTARPTKVAVLPDSGTLSGHVTTPFPGLKMFSATIGIRVLHFSYNASTKFSLNGRACGPEALGRGAKVRITYRRDKYGRLACAKVEVTT